MVIQGTQVPMYINTHSFYIFLIFSFYFYFWEQNKTKKKKQTNNMKAWKKDAYAWRHDRKV